MRGIIVCGLAALASLTLGAAFPPLPPKLSSVAMIYDPSGHGSGVWISPDTVLTARHVVEFVNINDIRVKADDGALYNALSVRLSETNDFALITIHKPANVEPVKVDCSLPEPLTEVYGVGYPLNLPKLTVLLRVSGYGTLDLDTGAGDVPIMMVDGTVIPGDSGGPVFTSKGVVGLMDGMFLIPSGFQGSPAGIAFVTPLAKEPLVCP